MAVEGHSVSVIRHHASATIELSLSTVGVPSFSLSTLDKILSFGRDLRAEFAEPCGAPWERIVLTSSDPINFSMGGDLASIAELARKKDVEGVTAVGEAVSQALLAVSDGFGLELETVAIVGGRAFGFGFELALACDRLVAAPAATFGLPEGRFGLFAGMGAVGLITRRASKAVMSRLVIEGDTIDAAAGQRLGIIDQVLTNPLRVLLEEGQASSRSDWALNRRKTLIRRRAKRYAFPEIREGLRVWEAAVLSMPDKDIATAIRISQMQANRSQRRSS